MLAAGGQAVQVTNFSGLRWAVRSAAWGGTGWRRRVAALTGPRFPWGTLLVNIVGSFIIGWFGALTADTGPLDVPAGIRLLVLVGFCGGFTTFSSFSLQTLELLQSGEVMRAAGYVLGSVALCLIFVWFGVVLGRA